MSPPLKNGSLRGLTLAPDAWFLVIDPGGRCGIAAVDSGSISTNVAQLDELPGVLYAFMGPLPVGSGPAFVVCEDFHLLSGKARQQSGSIMPAAIGIGMVRTACEWTDTEMILVAPNVKRAGFLALNAAGLAAYNACRNDHERDAVSIAGYVQREMRRLA